MKAGLKKIIFLGKKDSAVEALEFLLMQGIKVKLIVAPGKEDYKKNLRLAAKQYKIPFISDDQQLYRLINKKSALVKDVDMVISFLYWKKIKEPLIKLGRLGCINFHPAPLPDYKSRAGYNTAILEGKNKYGVSAHYIDSEFFDCGPIIKVLRFKIDPRKETAYSLERLSQKKLVLLFKNVISQIKKRGRLKTKKNSGGLYLNNAELEKLKYIDLKKDNPSKIDRKIRAFFFPPYQGAKIKVRGQEFTLINGEILNFISRHLKKYD